LKGKCYLRVSVTCNSFLRKNVGEKTIILSEQQQKLLLEKSLTGLSKIRFVIGIKK